MSAKNDRSIKYSKRRRQGRPGLSQYKAEVCALIIQEAVRFVKRGAKTRRGKTGASQPEPGGKKKKPTRFGKNAQNQTILFGIDKCIVLYYHCGKTIPRQRAVDGRNALKGGI